MDIIQLILIAIVILVICVPVGFLIAGFSESWLTPKSEKEVQDEITEKNHREHLEIEKAIEEREKRYEKYGPWDEYYPGYIILKDKYHGDENDYFFKRHVYCAAYEYYKKKHKLYIRCMNMLREMDPYTLCSKKEYITKILDTRKIENVLIENLHDGGQRTYSFTETHTLKRIGRTVAGSIFGGTTGAVLGAFSAPDETTYYTRSIPDTIRMRIKIKGSSEQIVLQPPAQYQDFIEELEYTINDILRENEKEKKKKNAKKTLTRELDKLLELKEKGAITKDEFEILKKKIIKS